MADHTHRRKKSSNDLMIVGLPRSEVIPNFSLKDLEDRASSHSMVTRSDKVVRKRS